MVGSFGSQPHGDRAFERHTRPDPQRYESPQRLAFHPPSGHYAPVRVRGVRFLRGPIVALVAAFLPAVGGSGCASCETKCEQPLAEIHVTPGIAEVEVCDDEGTCTRQAFGVSDENTRYLSFSVVVPSNNGSVPLSVRGFLADGTEAVAGELVAKSRNVDCGCRGPAEVFVLLDGVVTLKLVS